MSKFPALFVNHGGGPLPLLGKQPAVAEHLQNAASQLGRRPDRIVIVSAHWESDPVAVTSQLSPPMLYDYHGFPPETYQYKYPAPGDPDLARRVRDLLGRKGVDCKLDGGRGFDHGVFVPLMLMYPEADIPVVCVSLHSSLSASLNMRIGEALAPLRNEGTLVLGSGYTFHNMRAFFDPSRKLHKSALSFNSWLKDTMLKPASAERRNEMLEKWEDAPGARDCHPREEHLLPLLVVSAAAGNDGVPALIYDSSDQAEDEYAVSAYLFG